MKRNAIMHYLLLGAWILFAILLSACHASSDANDMNTGSNPSIESEENNTNEHASAHENNSGEETTLIWATHNPGSLEEEKEAIEEQFPHVTIEFVNVQPNRESIEEMLVAQIEPDIIHTYNAYRLPNFLETGLAYNMDELVDETNFDLSQIEEGLLNRIRSYSSDQGLYLLPYRPDLLALYYNKDIFDTLGRQYPTDGMNWDEVLDIGRELTVEDSGVEYQGLNIWNPFFPGEAYDVTYVDPDTHEPQFADEHGLRQGFELYQQMQQIPGNTVTSWHDPFLVDRTLAMVALYQEIDAFLDHEEESGFNWDMVSWPVFDDNPGMNPVQGGPVFGVASTAANPQQAFDVLAFLLSDEYQAERVRQGHSTPLADDDIKQQIYADEIDDNKNVQALFYNEYNDGPERRSPYDNVLDTWRGDLIEEMIAGERDITEMLREYEELSVQEIEEQRNLLE